MTMMISGDDNDGNNGDYLMMIVMMVVMAIYIMMMIAKTKCPVIAGCQSSSIAIWIRIPFLTLGSNSQRRFSAIQYC